MHDARWRPARDTSWTHTARCVACERAALTACWALQGLGFPALSNLKTVPVFFNMIDNGDLDANTFGIFLNPAPTAEPAGEITFGGVNTTHFAGELFEVPVVKKTCAPFFQCAALVCA